MRSLKVALVSDEFPPYVHGGAGTFCYHLAYWLSNKGVSTTVFSARSKKFVKEKVNDYLEVVRLPLLDLPPRFVWFQLRNFATLLKHLQGFSVIHSITPEIAPICAYAKKRLKKALVTSYHGYSAYEMKASINSPFSSWTADDFGYHVFEYPLFETGNRLSIAFSDHVISCSHVILTELKSTYKNLDLKKSSVIYNGIDIDEIDDIRKNCITTEESREPTIVYYGRLYWLKGISFLIDAFRILLRDYPNLTLKVFGSGPLEQQVQAMASDPQLEGKVRFHGKIPRHELLMEVMEADVVALPSIREAQPISVLEAMACKKPVVVFDRPFAREYIIDSTNGLLAKEKDSADLADKISMLLSNKKLRNRLGQNAYEYVKQNHNWANLIDRYIDVYERVALSD